MGALQRAELRRSARRASKKWKRGGGQSYSKLVHAYFQSEQYAKLSPRAVKLLVDLTAQYRGINNGDLTTAWSVMQRCGWKSKDLLYKAQSELEQRGWIVRMRQGLLERGKHTATLWALTFEGINDCGSDKRDAGTPKPDTMPLHLWKNPAFDTPPGRSGRRFSPAIQKKVLVRVPGLVRSDSRGGGWPFPPLLARVPDRKAA